MTDEAAITGMDGKRVTGPRGKATRIDPVAKDLGKMSQVAAIPSENLRSPAASGTWWNWSVKATTFGNM